MSAVTYGELEYGASKSLYRSDIQKILSELISVIPVIAIDVKAGKRYGEIRAKLEKSGRVIGNNDLWIAAHALALGITLVTNNEKEFRRVPGLVIQNWISGNTASKVHEKRAPYQKRSADLRRL